MENTATRTPAYGNFGETERREQAEIGRPQDAARGERARAREILAGLAAVRARAMSCAAKWIVSPSTRTRSCGITVSQPAGIGAPVMMRTHDPAATAPSNGWPASAVPATASVTSACGDACVPVLPSNA